MKEEDVKAVKSYKEQYYTMYSLCQDVFNMNIIDIIKEESEVEKVINEIVEKVAKEEQKNWVNLQKMN